MRSPSRFLPGLLPAFACGIRLAADPIPGLFPTGVNDSGAPLAAGATDPHWQLVSSPDPSRPGPAAFVVNEGFPIPPWLANSATSKWIGPRADAGPGTAPGDYVYRLVFSLSDFDPETAVITGRWSSDNAGVDIRLNGVALGLTYDGDFSRFSAPFEIREGFVDGPNTLEFVVNNAGDSANPTGFRVELAGTADAPPPAGTPPTIRTEPADASAAPGESLTLVVGANGARPLQYQWRFNGLPLSRATNASYSIPSMSEAWVGGYSAVVRNDWGMVTSRTARVTLGYRSARNRLLEPPGPSSRRSGLAFSEIHYHPADRADGLNLEFVELYNSNPFAEELGGWRLSGEWDFTLPAGTLIGPNGHLVIAADPDAIRTVHGITNVVGGIPSRLNNAGGVLRLRKPSGAIVLELEYDDSHPWPVAADGQGPSLVAARPSLGEANPAAWRASTRVGGSPGTHDPEPAGPFEGIVINEVLAHPIQGGRVFVELFNPAPFSRDVSGCVMRAGTNAPVRLQPGSVIPALGWIRFEPAGWILARNSTPVLLTDPEGTTVLDAVAVPGQDPGVSAGRSPDGGETWRALRTPTPATANALPAPRAAVINEVHYHPLDDIDGEEFVEILNPGPEPLDVSGWQFTDGISFTFPAGTKLAPAGLLVVARDPVGMRAANPDLAVGAVLGPFGGTLSNSGETLRLSHPVTQTPTVDGLAIPVSVLVPVDEVTWRDGGRWSRWADGGGSSLERIDPRSEPDAPDAWAPSDESARAPWTLIEASGPLDLTHPSVPSADQLQVMLLGEGEALLDDVEVIVGGRSVIGNGGFEAGLGSWTPQGTHRPSGIVTTGARTGARALRITATERGDHVANRIRVPLTQTLPPGTTVTIRAWARWMRGHPEILLRLRNGGLEATGRLATPVDGGTPGRPNSALRANGRPVITEVRHEPVVPAAGVPVRVFARVRDPDGIGSVQVRWRLDPATGVSSLAMRDDGAGGDERAGDGVFTATIPGQGSGSMAAFHISCTDGIAPAATSVFPSGAPARECLVRWGEPGGPGVFGTYRLWLTQSTVQRWASREAMSNEGLDGTLVLGTNRVVYNVEARYSGSSFTAGGYNSPVGNLCGYDITVPDDDAVLGGNRVLLDWPIRDNTAVREHLMFWFLEQLGLPNMYRRHVHMYVNGQRRGSIYEDIQQPGSDTIQEWFPNDADGSLWKTDCWNEFSDAGGRLDPCILNTLEVFNSRGVRKVGRYRWNWRPRAVRGSANDFSDLFALVDAMNVPAASLPASAEALVDVDHWMRTFAMNDLASFWDAFGNPNGKNTFLYKPQNDRWRLLCWDFDVGLGVFNDPVDAPLFDCNDPVVSRLYQSPPLVRRYWTAMDEALEGFFRTGSNSAIDRFLDRRTAALQAGGAGTAGPEAIKSWINGRRSYLIGQLNRHRSDFSIRSNGGADFTTADPVVTLIGSAPVRVASLKLNGIDWPVTWTGVTNWSMRLALRPGLNALEIAGMDRNGVQVPGALDTIRVNATGTPPPVAAVRINEWMADNDNAVPDPTNGEYDDWFELFNIGDIPVDLSGYTLTDDLARPARFTVPGGFVLQPRAALLVWADGQPEQTVPGISLHAAFRLARAGSDLALFDPYGRPVDAVRFGAQITDVSEGRWGDGAPGPFFRLSVPTPGTTNSLPAPGVLDLSTAVELDPDRAVVVLEWKSIPGRAYRVEMRRDLTSAWEPLEPDIQASGDRAAADLPEPDEPDGSRFFRVRLLP